MSLNSASLSNFQSTTKTLDPNSNALTSPGLFSHTGQYYLNCQQLYLAYYGKLPNLMWEDDVNCRKAIEWFATHYQEQITDVYYSKRHFTETGKRELDDVYYFVYQDLLVYFDTGRAQVYFMFRETPVEQVEALFKAVLRFKKSASSLKSEILLLVTYGTGIDTKSMQISRPKLSIEDNYNDDFKPIHQTILRRLSKKEDKGLVLLHGKPGTGKTSYIRYLISRLRKNVIFLPLNMASAITNPELISILIDNPNSVFVIEDAENIVVDREKEGQSPVSTLLNISDGLLSDCLNIQIICSFNTDISKVDTALLRKGRLIAKYEFKELLADKAQHLSSKLGFKSTITAPMTLAAIYNQEDLDFQQQNKGRAIGFTAAVD